MGYRSQTREAQESDYLLSAQDGLLFDPGLKGFAKRIIGDSKRQKTAIVDEIRAHELFTEYSIELKDLQRINDEWQGTSAGAWATSIIGHLTTSQAPDFKRIKESVLNLSELERRQIIQRSAKFGYMDKPLTENQIKCGLTMC